MLDLQQRVNELEVQIDNILHFNVPQRIVCFLKKLAPDQDNFMLPLTKGTLSLQIGIEAETFSRSLKTLPTYGGQVSGKQVTIDHATSRRTVCNNCAARDWCKAY